MHFFRASLTIVRKLFWRIVCKKHKIVTKYFPEAVYIQCNPGQDNSVHDIWKNLLWFSGIFAVEIQRNSHDNSAWRGSTAAKKADALIRCRCASFFVVCLLQKKKNKDRLRHKSRFETRGKYEGYQHSWGIKPVPIKTEVKFVHISRQSKRTTKTSKRWCQLQLILISNYLRIIVYSEVGLVPNSYLFHNHNQWYSDKLDGVSEYFLVLQSLTESQKSPKCPFWVFMCLSDPLYGFIVGSDGIVAIYGVESRRSPQAEGVQYLIAGAVGGDGDNMTPGRTQPLPGTRHAWSKEGGDRFEMFNCKKIFKYWKHPEHINYSKWCTFT